MAGTGCSTQPDPIGLAGGLNLRRYADGDPVNGFDPHGLKVCFGRASRERLVRETERATQSKITLDADGCISSVEATGDSRELGALRARLLALVQSPEVFYVGITGRLVGSHTDYTGRRVGMALERPHAYRTWGTDGACSKRVRTHDQAAVLAHELLGHLWNSLVYPNYYERKTIEEREADAMAAQNLYHRAAALEVRCGY